MSSLSFELNEKDAYNFAQSAIMGLKERRTLDNLAPMELPLRKDSETGYYIVFLQIPEDSKLSYFETVNQYKAWLEQEISETGQASAEFTSSFHVGKFTPEAATRGRSCSC